MKLESVGALFVLVVLCALIAAILFMLVRFWGECRTDTAFAKERLSWPTTTVQATLFDTSLRRYGKTSTTMVIGHYRYEFGGSEHTAEVSERIEIFAQDSGFVFNSIHNIQSNVPTENILAMFKAVNDARGIK